VFHDELESAYYHHRVCLSVCNVRTSHKHICTTKIKYGSELLARFKSQVIRTISTYGSLFKDRRRLLHRFSSVVCGVTCKNRDVESDFVLKDKCEMVYSPHWGTYIFKTHSLLFCTPCCLVRGRSKERVFFSLPPLPDRLWGGGVPGALPPRMKRPHPEANHSPAPGVEVKNAWSYT